MRILINKKINILGRESENHTTFQGSLLNCEITLPRCRPRGRFVIPFRIPFEVYELVVFRTLSTKSKNSS